MPAKITGRSGGYDLAHEIDTAINKILDENFFHDKPSCKLYAREWMKFARTIKTSAEIIEDIARDALRRQ